ncbi:MAG: alpha/beta hydrolase [Phenylobacterium sp.]
MPTIRFTNRDGLALVADEIGRADGPAVLLTHGGGQTRHAWSRTGERLAGAGYHVFNLDMRGHGESGWSGDQDYTLDAYVGDLVDVVSAIGGEPIALVGASLGGLISLVATGEDRAPTSRLVLVDVVPRIEPSGGRRISEFMQSRPDGFGSLEEAADAIAAYIPERPRPASNAGLEKNLRLRDGRWHWHWDPALMGARGIGRSLETSRVDRAAANVGCPTLLVRGVLSDVVSPAGVEHLRGLIPDLAVCDVADAGHMVAGDRNDVFASAVLEFLAGAAAKVSNRT